VAWRRRANIRSRKEGNDVRRVLRGLALVAVLACLAVLALPTSTTAGSSPASQQQIVAHGEDGVAAIKYVCRRNFEGCVNSTIHGCKGPC